MLESPFDRLAGFKNRDFLKKRPQHRCFLVNIAKFIFMKIYEQLLLPFLLLTVNIPFYGLVSALNSIGLLQRSSLRFKEFSLGCLVVSSPLIWKKRKISRNGHSLKFVVTRCTTRCHSLSLDVAHCHSLSLVVPPVVTSYHSLSLVVTRCTTCCHSLSLIITRRTTGLSFYKRYFHLVQSTST